MNVCGSPDTDRPGTAVSGIEALRVAKSGKRESELRQQLYGQVGKRSNSQDDLVKGAAPIMQELTLLTDHEFNLDGEQIGNEFVWVNWTEGTTFIVESGKRAGTNNFTLHSHAYVEGGGAEVLKTMGTLHSAFDVAFYGKDISNVQTSYVVFNGKIEAVEFGDLRGTNAFKDLHSDIETYVNTEKDVLDIKTNREILKPRIVK